MKLFTIKNIGKTFFWTSFILGNICLFGYVFTKNQQFAIAGFWLIVYGSLINGLVFFGLLIFGFLNDKYFDIAIKSAMIVLLNIPIAILYAYIGYTIYFVNIGFTFL